MKQHNDSSWFIALIIGVATVVSSAPSHAAGGNDLPVAAGANSAEALKCRRVSNRFSICGDTNFRNKFVAGFGVHFSTIDPGGQLKAVGTQHQVAADPASCAGLSQEAAVPAAIAKQAVDVCRQMVAEHKVVRETQEKSRR